MDHRHSESDGKFRKLVVDAQPWPGWHWGWHHGLHEPHIDHQLRAGLCIDQRHGQQRVGAYSRQRFRVTQVRRACDVMMMPLHNIYHLGVVLV